MNAIESARYLLSEISPKASALANGLNIARILQQMPAGWRADLPAILESNRLTSFKY